PFLLISPDARASGMGETGVAIADDINAIYWNPGGLAFLDYFTNESGDKPFTQTALSFSPWLPQFNADLFYSYGTIGRFFEELDGTVAFNFIFMNLGEFTRTAEDGRVLGKFTSNEFSLGLSYGTPITNDLGIGFQLRYIRSNLAPVGQGQREAGAGNSVGFDLGLLYKPSGYELLGVRNPLSFGFNLQNVGPKITYINESDPLPTNLKIGAAWKLVKDEFNDLKIAFDFQKLLVKRDSLSADPLPLSLVTAWKNPGVEFSVGAEYWYENLFAFRAGYFTEPSRLGNRKFWNFGAGVRYDIFKIDFSFINTIEENHPLANTMRFSMLIDLK
ncbi:MAG TPA: PorV/PorQ family protein, partial [Candidatus Kapabacteria bacterium]|nr:PorV/PorQ family protein [Candidatus Kapabacteria bacterium]